MTDNEIIKALECCIANDNKCPDCPIFGSEICGKPALFFKEVLDLINRQQAEIERLKKLLEEADINYNKCAKRFYKEGIKDFKHTARTYFRLAFLRRKRYEKIFDEVETDLLKEKVGEE